jgi:cobalamin biosynthesis protein CobT
MRQDRVLESLYLKLLIGDNMELNKDYCQINFSAIYNSNPNGLGATRASLLRLLRSLDLVGWNSYEESGRLDRKAFTRFATGSNAVFSKRTYVEAEKSAVSILIDCSGSMDVDGRIQCAEVVTIQLAKILDKANVDFQVNGFFGDTYRNRVDATGATASDTLFKQEYPTFVPFKTWGESVQKASAKLGSIRHWAQSSTPDYSSIAITIEELSKRTESRRILFLVTDAGGYEQSHMKHLQKLADKLGVKIIAIGIGNTEVKQCFKASEDVVSLDGLASASFNKLLKELR